MTTYDVHAHCLLPGVRRLVAGAPGLAEENERHAEAMGGVLDRHPGLRVVAAHGGGYLPTYPGRSDHAHRMRDDARSCAEPPSAYLRRLWFDSIVYDTTGLRHLIERVGAERVVLGTDFPFDMGLDDPVGLLDSVEGLTAGDRAAVAGGNAEALLSATAAASATAGPGEPPAPART